MEYTKAFELIADKVGEELTKQGYTRQKVASEEGKLVALFTSQNVAYSVVYVIDKQQMLLRSCAMTDEGPDNEWKTLSTWLYDDYVASQKDAESIANDFVDGVSNTSAIKRAKQVKQKKKKEDGTEERGGLLLPVPRSDLRKGAHRSQALGLHQESQQKGNRKICRRVQRSVRQRRC